jgi:hypothetical protein
MFMKLIERLENKEIDLSMEAIHKYLSQPDHMSSLESLRVKLEGNIYDTNKDMARFVLSKIEESKQSTREHRDLWEREENRLVWTIEHVFPEGQNIPDAWVQMIADGDRVEAKALQEQYVHSLGNLTLTGYNSTLSNMSFEKKNERMKDGKYVGYKNGLYLNRDLCQMSSWGIDDIKARNGRLVADAVELFKFDDE